LVLDEIESILNQPESNLKSIPNIPVCFVFATPKHAGFVF